jgi:pyruvate dehydrogenase E2 component (dihydrolipoyllysine-residue acetyltransferase)
MPTDIIMPQMGESIFEGTITKWLKKPGDAVEKDEPLFEISTDKVDAEIPSPIAGILGEIKFPEGATVQVNTVVAVLVDSGSSVAAPESQRMPSVPKTQFPASDGPPNTQTPAATVRQVAGGTEIVMPQMGESIFEGTITKWLKKAGDSVQKDEPLFEISTDKVDAEIPSPVDGVLTEIKVVEGATVQVNTVVAVIGGGTSGTGELSSSAKRRAPEIGKNSVAAQPQSAPPQVAHVVRSSPLVRRIATENNIDLVQVPGTGSAGRITKDDIFGFMNRPTSTKAAMAPSQVAQISSGPELSGELVPLTKMRTIIAQRMAESKRTIPHAHTVYKVDMTRIVKLRERERVGFEQRHGFKLTYMPFIAVATIDALRKFPVLNASLVEKAIQYHANIHLGIAVALEWGLIVPVIRASEGRDFVGVARAMNDLAGRARSKKLLPDEVGGSTFTLTNPGVFGGEYGLPIINQPESAILAIGGLRKEPVVLTDAEGNDTIAIRSVQYFCLGFDHRLIDGADSGKFMTEFKAILENWNTAIG